MLTVFSDLMELGKLVNEPGVPDAIRDGALPPRKWLDDILDTTAVFDTLAITRLSEWFGWFESALDCWQQERPLPEIPAHLLTSAGENIPPIEAAPAPLARRAWVDGALRRAMPTTRATAPL